MARNPTILFMASFLTVWRRGNGETGVDWYGRHCQDAGNTSYPGLAYKSENIQHRLQFNSNEEKIILGVPVCSQDKGRNAWKGTREVEAGGRLGGGLQRSCETTHLNLHCLNYGCEITFKWKGNLGCALLVLFLDYEVGAAKVFGQEFWLLAGCV